MYELLNSSRVPFPQVNPVHSGSCTWPHIVPLLFSRLHVPQVTAPRLRKAWHAPRLQLVNEPLELFM